MANGQLDKVIHYLRTVTGGRDEDSPGDGLLLDRFLRLREEEAFTVLVRRHGPMVLGVCLRVLGNAHDADDAFQATFLVLARKAASIHNRDSVGSWLYGVAYRTALRARAAALRRRARERQMEDMARTDPEAEAAWRELRPLLDAELERLPEKYRAPLVLCYLEGKTNAEAARQLGWTKGTVSGRLARARDLLRRRLGYRGFALPGAALAALLCQHGAAAAPASSLVMATVKAALLGAAGPAVAAGVVSGPVAALVEGVVQPMLVTKMKLVTAVLLALGLFGTGAGVVVYALAPEAGEHQAGAAASQGQKAPKQDADAAKLKEENDRLRRELEAAKQELKRVQQLAERLRREAEAARDRAEAARRDALEQERRARAAAQEALRQAAERVRAEALRAVQAEQQARAKAKQSAERAISVNNLKQLALAVHNYAAVHGHLPPPAVYGKDGKALLSWRVLLLPYLEQQDLFKQFKMDEPWDGPHNKRLLRKMPKVFEAKSNPKAPHATHYLAFTGKDTLFEGPKGITFAQVVDGTSNTLLFVEAGKAVAWTKPDDLPYEPGKALPKLGGLWQGGFYAAVCDGSVRFIRSDFDADLFRSAVTRNDGQVIDLNKLSP